MNLDCKFVCGCFNITSLTSFKAVLLSNSVIRRSVSVPPIAFPHVPHFCEKTYFNISYEIKLHMSCRRITGILVVELVSAAECVFVSMLQFVLRSTFYNIKSLLMFCVMCKLYFLYRHVQCMSVWKYTYNTLLNMNLIINCIVLMILRKKTYIVFCF